MLILQNSACAFAQKLSGMLRRNQFVAPSFWRWRSLLDGGQVELRGQLVEVLLVKVVL